jgi:DNA polymerase V
MHMSPAVLGPPIFLPAYLKAVRAGFPSPADDYLDAPIDLSRALIQNAPATFIMTVAGDSAIDVGIFDGSLMTVDRNLVPRDGDAVVVDVNGERSIKVFRIIGGRSCLSCRGGNSTPAEGLGHEIRHALAEIHDTVG